MAPTAMLANNAVGNGTQTSAKQLGIVETSSASSIRSKARSRARKAAATARIGRS